MEKELNPMRNYRKPWTFDDGEFIKNNYLTMSDATLAMHLGRSAPGVAKYRKDLDLHGPKSVHPHRWTSPMPVIKSPADYLAQFPDIDDQTAELMLHKRRCEVVDCMLVLCENHTAETMGSYAQFIRLRHIYGELNRALMAYEHRKAA